MAAPGPLLNPECDSRSSTIYEAQAYPYRTFPPAVAVAAVIELLSVEGATAVSVAKLWQCDPRTLGPLVGVDRLAGRAGRVVQGLLAAGTDRGCRHPDVQASAEGPRSAHGHDPSPPGRIGPP